MSAASSRGEPNKVVPLYGAASVEGLHAVGVGYLLSVPAEGLSFEVRGLQDSRRGATCELSLVSGGRTIYGPKVFNLLTDDSRTAAAIKRLAPQLSVNWDAHLAELSRQVLKAHRGGSPVEEVGLDPIAEPDWFIEPFAPRDEIMWLYGSYGSLKSITKSALAVSCKTGREIIPGLRPMRKTEPLLLEFEQRNRATTNNVVARICHGAGFDPVGIKRKWLDRPLIDVHEAVAEEIAAGGFDPIFVDSAGPAIGPGREGSSFNDRALDLARALRSFGRTAIVIDQVTGDENKANRSTVKPIDGVQKMYQARAAYWIGKERDRVDDEVDLVIKQTKLTEGKPLAPFGLAVSFADGVIRFRRKGIDAPELLAGMPGPIRIRQLLKAGSMSTSEIAGELGIPSSSVRTYLTRELRDAVVRLPNKSWGLKA